MLKSATLIAGIFCLALFGGAGVMLSETEAAEITAEKSSEDFDAIRFADQDWAPELLQIAKDGPSVLPADFDVQIDPPTSNSSAETRADLDAMLVMQKRERSTAQRTKIQQENTLPGPTSNFTVDGLFDPAKYPETDKFLDIVNKEVGYFIMREKVHYQRARPTQLEPKLRTLIKIPPHSSYPSGHAGQSYAVALVLAELDPARRDEYLQHAVNIGHRREIAGVHYPADSTAGRALATNVVAALLKEPSLQAQLAKARQEFATQ